MTIRMSLKKKSIINATQKRQRDGMNSKDKRSKGTSV